MRILLTFIMAIFAIQLFACSCMYTPMGVNKIMQSEALVGGKVIKKSVVGFDDDGKEVALSKEEQNMSFGSFKYTFQIQERIKGVVGKESTIHFYSAMNSAACGVDYNEGSELYIFLYTSNGSWSTNSCSGNLSKEHMSDETKNIIKKYKDSNTNQKWFNEFKRLEAVGKVKKGKARGNWKFYFTDGTLAAEGKYKKGKKKGAWKVYKTPADLPQFDEAIDPNRGKVTPVLESIEFYKKGEKIKTETVGAKEMK